MNCFRSGCCLPAVVAASAYDAVEVRLCVAHARLQEVAGETLAHFQLLMGVDDPEVVALVGGQPGEASGAMRGQ